MYSIYIYMTIWNDTRREKERKDINKLFEILKTV